MPNIKSNRRTPAAGAVVLVLLLGCLGLAACGGSSKSSSTSTNASAATTTTTGATAAKGPNAGRFTALRECLQKNGITLPKLPAGKRPVPGVSPGGIGGGGFALPKGMSKAQYEAVVTKCGGLRGGAFNGGGARFRSPVFKTALAKFATCLRENGVNVPAPNTSGKGPVFGTKGINTSSAQFKAAEKKCQSVLASAFRRAPGSGGSEGSGSAPAGGASGGAPTGGGGATPAG
jgi:hypothetical protein